MSERFYSRDGIYLPQSTKRARDSSHEIPTISLGVSPRQTNGRTSRQVQRPSAQEASNSLPSCSALCRQRSSPVPADSPVPSDRPVSSTALEADSVARPLSIVSAMQYTPDGFAYFIMLPTISRNTDSNASRQSSEHSTDETPAIRNSPSNPMPRS